MPSDRLIAARFVSRPNRFIVRAAMGDRADVVAHLGDPGRLSELLLPGAALRLRPVRRSAKRKTRYTVALVRSSDGRTWVSLETGLANVLAEELLRGGRIRGIGAGWTIRREVRCGDSRLDFRLRNAAGATLWVEVKSVTFVENGVARFPDAPTARGKRHLEELTACVNRGDRAAVLFVVQRGDAGSVVPYRAIDPLFAAALGSARRAGVMLRGARFALSDSGRRTYLGPLRVRT